MAIPTALLRIGRPGNAPIVVRQGDTYQQPFTLTLNGVAVDISGLTAAMKIRATITGAVLATPTCTIPTGTDGLILAAMTPAVTAALSVAGAAATEREPQLGYYDVDLTDGTDRVTVVGGTVSLWREVTV